MDRAIPRSPDARWIIGRGVRVARERLGLTLEELARSAGISYQYLSGVETGKANFSIGVLEKIAGALQTPIHVLVVEAYRRVGGAP